MFLIDLEKVNSQVGAAEALMNTLIGMGTVFVVLILISVIIFLLKYVPGLFEKKIEQAAKSEKTAAAPAAVATAPTPEKDTQLVAVLMAAIAAQLEAETGAPVSTEGLVIRSIKKRTFTN